MARVLIVGCGCRGQALGSALMAEGHAVRGTTRSPERCREIERTGAEAAVAEPDRLGTVMVHLAGVSVLCWLMGTATADAAADLHGPRLRTLLERLVDTPVRGIAYEAAGSVDAKLLSAGAQAVRAAAETWRMLAEVVEADPEDRDSWVRATTAAVTRLL